MSYFSSPFHLLQCDIKGQRILTVLLIFPESENHSEIFEICCEVARLRSESGLRSEYLSGVIQLCPFDMNEVRLMN